MIISQKYTHIVHDSILVSGTCTFMTVPSPGTEFTEKMPLNKFDPFRHADQAKS